MVSDVVATRSGAVRGGIERGIHVFRGVPYAAAPVGERRFRLPQRPEPWSDPLDATSFGPVSRQHRMPGLIGDWASPMMQQSFDSLRLNVWTPDVGAAGLPVLVWLHGGGYYAGSGCCELYDGTAFARRGVVTVTINYRLGAEGFLYLADQFAGFEDTGALGTADQVAALQWVQDNIAAFGGDPGRVTVAGESAGAFGVATLMASPSAKGLFTRAISQSGNAENTLSGETASGIAVEFLDRVGVARGDIAALRDMPVARSLEVVEAMTTAVAAGEEPDLYREALGSGMAFQPVHGTEALPVQPLAAIAEGSADGIALLLGSNADEMMIFFSSRGDVLTEDVVRGMFAGMFGAAGDDAFDTYRRNRSGAAAHEVCAAAEGDRAFWIPTIGIAEAQSRRGADVYMYRFDWQSRAPGDFGAFHMLDVPFVFGTLGCEVARSFTGPDAPENVAEEMNSAWAAFVETGVPGAGWDRYLVDTRMTRIFGGALVTVDDPRADERALWSVR